MITSSQIMSFIGPAKTKQTSTSDICFWFGPREPSRTLLEQVIQKKVSNVKRLSTVSLGSCEKHRGLQDTCRFAGQRLINKQ